MAGFGVRSLAVPVRMVPHPAVMLALDFGAGRATVEDAAGRRRGSLVAGPGYGFGGAAFARGTEVECVQVRLSPLIARAVLGVSLAELRDATVDADDLLGHRETERIRARLAELPSWQARFGLLDAWLARRYAPGTAVAAEVAWAWRRIVAVRGAVRVDRLAAEVGWSRRRMWSRFGAQLGLTPKRAATLVRFDHAAHRLVAGHAAARVAADVGYADQSHLHREVRAFAGGTPAGLADEPFLAIDDVAWPGQRVSVRW